MSAESPQGPKSQAEKRPQLLEDIETSRSGENASESASEKGARSQAARTGKVPSISGGGIWGGGGSRSIEDQMAQIERLRARRKKLRESALVSHDEMRKQNEDYREIQKKIIAIRKRLNEIAVKGEGDERKEEVQKLRDELARHFIAFRKAVQEKKQESADGVQEQQTGQPSVEQLEANVDKQADKLNAQWEQGDVKPNETEVTSPGWKVTPHAAYDESMLEILRKTHAKETIKSEQWDVKAETGYSNDQETQELLKNAIPQTGEGKTGGERTPEPPKGKKESEKEYEKRLKERNVWREKKHAFDTAYRSYVAESASRKANRSFVEKLQFWKKEKQPEALVQLEKEYQDARRAYALSLHGAILDRIDARNPNRETERDKQILQAALANRFIIKAAHDRLRSEGEFIPHVEGRRTLQKLHQALQRNGKLIKAAGYAAVGGIALASGGVAVAVAALAGKAVQTKITTAAIAGGLTAGSLAGNFVGDRIIAGKDKKRVGAMRNAVQSFSSRSLDRLEVEYLNAYRSHTKAVEQKKYIVGAGAAAGALGGALLAGNFEVPDELPSLPETPQEPVVPVPPAEVPITKPDDLLPEPPYPMPNTEPIEINEDKINNFEKGPEFKTEGDVDEKLRHDHEYTHDHEHEHVHEHEHELPSLLYTFEGGDVDTVSEALFETWKDNPSLLDEEITKSEFLAQMYGAIAEIEKDDGLRESLMTQMSISSGNIHEVLEGQTINLQPFFEYLNNRH